MKSLSTTLIAVFFTILLLSSCVNDLNVAPIDPDEITSEVVFKNEEGFKKVLAKIYAGLSVTGQQGPDGKGDVKGIDEGASSYLRQYWSLQQLPTDETVVAWNDTGIKDFHNLNWDSTNGFINGLYSRLFFQIALANVFIKNAQGKEGNIATFALEARFLRALSYYHALDLFGSVPFVNEDSVIGASLPTQISRNDLFLFLEKELIDLGTKMIAPNQNEYGRADRGAAWMLLAKLYLNAKVYIGEAKNTEAITELKKIIDAGYTLEADYTHLFLADNHLSDKTESIFLIVFDGNNLRTWGGTSFIINASYGAPLVATDYGADPWGGLSSTSALVNKFRATTPGDALTDGRGKDIILQNIEGFQEEIDDLNNYKHGLPVTKFRNLKRDGTKGSHDKHSDTDFILFRLADVYLMYAEAVLRGGTGGDRATALGYINQLRQRNSNGSRIAPDITDAQLNLDFLLDERSRELYWEAHRRTDLIRFEKFVSGDYLWPWKGGVKSGKGVESFRKLYPIPVSDLNANPNLKQNPGY